MVLEFVCLFVGFWFLWQARTKEAISQSTGKHLQFYSVSIKTSLFLSHPWQVWTKDRQQTARFTSAETRKFMFVAVGKRVGCIIAPHVLTPSFILAKVHERNTKHINIGKSRLLDACGM